MKLKKLPWRRTLLVLISLALLVWVIRTHSLSDALATLAQLEAVEILLLIAVNLLVISTFTGRWWLLLVALGQRVPYWRLMGYRLTAFAISYFTPGSHFGGEPYQIWAVSRWHGAPLPVSIAAVTLDKLLEMLINLAVLLVGVVALLAMSEFFAPWVERQMVVVAVLLLAIPVAFLVALWRGRHPLIGFVRWVGKFTRRPLMQSAWARTLHQSEEQAVWLCRQHPKTVGLAFLVTLLTWIGVIGEFVLLTRVLGLSLTPLQITASLVAARVAILLPMPAGLGALEAGQVLAMETVGVDAGVGIAIALVIRSRDVISGLIGLALGGAHLWERAAMPTPQWPPAPLPGALPEASAPTQEH